MRLFQYWHADPPPEIEALMTAARDGLDGIGYLRLDEATARAFVADACGPRALAAWDGIAPPAMRADLLRLLLLHAHGGVWADASYRFERPLAALLARSDRDLAPATATLMGNNLLVVRAPGNAFLAACIALVLDNIERRRFDSVLMATGPGALNAVRCALDPAARDGIRYFAGMIPEWVEWGWDECVAAADRIVAPDAAALAACRGLELMLLPEMDRWAVSQPSPHRGGGDHWRDRRGRLYRD